MNLFCIGEYLTPTSYGTVQYNLGDGKPKKKKYYPCNNVVPLRCLKFPTEMLLLFVWLYIPINQLITAQQHLTKKSRARGKVSSPDKVGRYMYLCTFFTVTILLVVLLALGDSDKMIHIPKEVHLSFSLSQSSQTISTVAFFSSFIFFCNITGEKSLQ